MAITFNVNGMSKTVDVDPETPLLWVLRDTLGMTGTKFGCGIAACGACTVHIDGVSERSCSIPVEFVAGREERAGQLQQILTPIRLMLKHQPYLGGRDPIFADYIPFGALQWLRVCSGLAMWDKDDPVRDWFERLLDLHDGAGRSVPEAG